MLFPSKSTKDCLSKYTKMVTNKFTTNLETICIQKNSFQFFLSKKSRELLEQ